MDALGCYSGHEGQQELSSSEDCSSEDSPDIQAAKRHKGITASTPEAVNDEDWEPPGGRPEQSASSATCPALPHAHPTICLPACPAMPTCPCLPAVLQPGAPPAFLNDNPEKHQGRTRTFPHMEGKFPAVVMLPGQCARVSYGVLGSLFLAPSCSKRNVRSTENSYSHGGCHYLYISARSLQFAAFTRHCIAPLRCTSVMAWQKSQALIRLQPKP